MKLTKKHLLVTLFSFGLVAISILPILNNIFSSSSFSQISLAATVTSDRPNPLGGLEEVRAKTSYLKVTDEYSLPIIIGNVIKILLGLLGVIAVIFVVVGGFQWMTAGGNEEKIKGAKRVIGQGIVGLVIVLAAYAIAHFVISQLAGKFMEKIE